MKPIFIFFLLFFFFIIHCSAQKQVFAPKKQLAIKLHNSEKVAVVTPAYESVQDVRNPAAASFDHPASLTLDRNGSLYVGENGHDIRRIDPIGNVTLFAGSDMAGYADGPRQKALFGSVPGIVADTLGNLFVIDGSNALIRKIDTNGVVSTLAGNLVTGNLDGQGKNAKFAGPSGITIDPLGNLYVTDQLNNNIRKITPDGTVTTIAGGVAGYADGTGVNASFNTPAGICVDIAGNLYVTDYGNNRIRKITPDGTVSTFAGSGLNQSANGAGLSASFNGPTSISIDSAQNLYVTEKEKVRKISPGGVVTTIAGSGKVGATDDQGLAASFNTLTGIAVDHSGIVFLADFNNQKLREICPSGMVSTLAGTGAFGTTNGNVGVLRNTNCPGGTGPTFPTVPPCKLSPITIPNVFTPNGDGINDRWNIAGLNVYPDCEVIIFDRYGQIVFQSKGYPNSWDGTYGGKPVPGGLYYYLIGNLCRFLSGYVAVLR